MEGILGLEGSLSLTFGIIGMDGARKVGIDIDGIKFGMVGMAGLVHFVGELCLASDESRVGLRVSFP
jgi:hypothetical protein